jgi:hypothetical protein
MTDANLDANLARQFAALRDDWLAGGRATAALVPEDWRAFLADADAEEGERRLLALAGQAWDVAFRPVLPKDARGREDLPPLALPTLPEALRPLFRGALEWGHAYAKKTVALRLVERRGFSAHPLDWFPAASADDTPDLYAPWLDWLDCRDFRERTDGRDAADELSEETWDDFYPAQRRLLLKTLRRQNPGRARELIAACAGREPAEKRLALIELLETGLSGEDAPYLQSLANDRSGKIKALAALLLARLRHEKEGAPDPELAELADFFELGSKGIFKRVKTVVAKTLKSSAQATRRAQLLERASFPEFASALALREDELIDGWQFGQREEVDPLLARMVATSAADESVARLAVRLLEEMHPALLTLLPRLDRAFHQRVTTKILTHPRASATDSGAAIWQLTKIEHGDLAGPKEILSSPVYQSLKIELGKETFDARALATLNAFAVVATAQAARAVIDDIADSCRIFRSSPSLAFLRLNAELTPTGEKALVSSDS